MGPTAWITSMARNHGPQKNAQNQNHQMLCLHMSYVYCNLKKKHKKKELRHAIVVSIINMSFHPKCLPIILPPDSQVFSVIFARRFLMIRGTHFTGKEPPTVAWACKVWSGLQWILLKKSPSESLGMVDLGVLDLGVEPKIGGKPPKWMVKIMKNPY